MHICNMYDKNYVVFWYTFKSHVVQDPWGRRQVPLFGCHFGKRLSVPLSKELRTTRSLLQKWEEQVASESDKWSCKIYKIHDLKTLGHFQFPEQKPSPKFLDPFFCVRWNFLKSEKLDEEVLVWVRKYIPTKLSNWRTFYPSTSLHDFHF